MQYFGTLKNPERVIDVLEASFNAIESVHREIYSQQWALYHVTEGSREAIAGLNERLLEHSIGYQYVGGTGNTAGQIIRMDSTYVHAETVLPALQLLSAPGFKGPEEEFLEAHRSYREGKYKDSNAGALRAFESTLKAICEDRKWPFDKDKATAKDLINIVLTNELVPPYLLESFTGIRSFTGTVATVRNKAGGHGQGKDPIEIPPHLAAYALHASAAAIVFCVSAHLAKGKP